LKNTFLTCVIRLSKRTLLARASSRVCKFIPKTLSFLTTVGSLRKQRQSWFCTGKTDLESFKELGKGKTGWPATLSLWDFSVWHLTKGGDLMCKIQYKEVRECGVHKMISYKVFLVPSIGPLMCNSKNHTILNNSKKK
jgi:hypothetical protein